MTTLEQLFHHDIDLKDWEALLAELSVESVGTILNETEAEAWELMRQYSHDDMPHAGNIYANVLLGKIKKEVHRLFGSAIDVGYSVNALDTSLWFGDSAIADMDDLENYLNDITGFDDFIELLNEMDSGLDAERSTLLTQLYNNGSDSIIDEYMPDNSEIELLDDELEVDKIPPHLKRALGAAYFIKAVILELIPNVNVEVQVANLEASINLHVRNKDINVRSLTDFTPYINDQSVIL